MPLPASTSQMPSLPAWVTRSLLGLALLLLLAAGAQRIFSQPSMPLLSAGLLCLALGAISHVGLRRWAFLLCLFTAMAVGMTFPAWFIGVGDFKFTALFVPILQVIMFCMGTTLSAADFARVLRMPAGVVVGLVCHYTIMPFLGYSLARLYGHIQPSEFSGEIGAGIILVGSVPAGLASTVMVYIARANVALSVTLTAVSSLIAPFVTPFLVYWLAGDSLAGAKIELHPGVMMWDLTKMTVIPVLVGLAWNQWMQGRARWLSRIMPYFSMAGIILMTLLTIAVGRDKLLVIGWALVGICFLHSTGGYLLGYVLCRLLGMKEANCRTIAIEVGMQNAGLAAGLAAKLQRVATLGLAPIVFGPVMNVTASTIANWWRTKPTPETDDAPPAK